MAVNDYTRPPAGRHHAERLPDFATETRDALAVAALCFFQAIDHGAISTSDRLSPEARELARVFLVLVPPLEDAFFGSSAKLQDRLNDLLSVSRRLSTVVADERRRECGRALV